MVSVKAKVEEGADAIRQAKLATIQESDIAAVFDPTKVRPKLRDFIDSLKFDYDLRLQLIGYGIDDQSSPRLHPLFDSEGSQRVRRGGRHYIRDKKYTAGVGAPNPGTVDFKPADGSPMQIETLMVLIGGTRATAGFGGIKKQNSDNKDLANYAFDNSITINEELTMPSFGKAQATVADTSQLSDSAGTLPIIHNPDILRFTMDSIANAEIFTIRMRALIHGPTDPTVTVQADLTEAAE